MEELAGQQTQCTTNKIPDMDAVSAVMKVEAMRKLETHEYKTSLIARKVRRSRLHCGDYKHNPVCVKHVLLACRHDLPADQLFGLQTAYEKQKAKKAKTKKDSEATSIFHLIGSLTGTPPPSSSSVSLRVDLYLFPLL
jgi:hypothetical protein